MATIFQDQGLYTIFHILKFISEEKKWLETKTTDKHDLKYAMTRECKPQNRHHFLYRILKYKTFQRLLLENTSTDRNRIERAINTAMSMISIPFILKNLFKKYSSIKHKSILIT